MKKYIPHILITLLAAAIIVLFVTGDSSRKNKLDERMSIRKQDKVPYGTYIAYNTLPFLFPNASIGVNEYEPGYWDELSMDASGQALIIISNRFGADRSQMDKLVEFARNGNDVFVSAMYLSAAADDYFNCSSSAYEMNFFSVKDLDENLKFSLSKPPFSRPLEYAYPGRTFSSYFTSLDTSATFVLGRDLVGRPNFIQMRAGKGNFFVHLEPLAFSNYFLLHKKNMSFLGQVMSLVRPGAGKIVWDEYYRNKQDPRPRQQKQESWLTVLFRYPAFKAALLTAIFSLLTYILMEMRRKQRPIPVIKRQRNESLDFVRTIGRLYYEKGDHRNLSRKMAAYFLEYVRNKYKLPTNILDDEFTRALHFKSGVPEAALKEIVSYIKDIDQAATISPAQLTRFHKKLEAFYQAT